jgi:DNA (cytosine-5)-methyltransferase 1
VKLGGLFSGIGGFELAWTRLGGEVAWMCEIDKQARKVLEARFPGVPIYEDVEQVDPADVEAVDVLSGGSPCQGFSIAGARAGLEHGESRLFADYVRIMDGLAERGLQWAVWENVPGVLSIKNPDGERTFSHVVGALVGAADAVRLDPKRKWNVGLASGAGRAVAWRVLDSRYFGVAQRRRRVFACVAFGDFAADRAGRALLAVGEGLRRDIASGESSGEAAAGGAAGRAGVPSCTGPLTTGGIESPRGTETSDSGFVFPDVPEVSGTVSAKWAKGTGGPSGDEAQNLVTDVAHTLTGEGFDASEDGTGRGTPIVPQAYGMYGSSGVEAAFAEEQPTITASHGQPGNVAQPAVLLTMRDGKPGGGKGPLLSEEASLTLATGNGQTLFQPQPEHYGVRRLTPVECERLQAFPDGWTEPAGSDSARYRALGNAVTVNTVGWILGRMRDVT